MSFLSKLQKLIKNMEKPACSKAAIICGGLLSIFLLLLCITACSNSDEEKKAVSEKNINCLEAVNIGKDTILNIAANYKNRLLEEETQTEEETEEETETETDEQPVENEQQTDETGQEQLTEYYIEKDTTGEKNTAPQEIKENTNNTEFVENGDNIWRYVSDIYPEGSEKAKLEEIFWREYGWSSYSAEKNDKMAAAMVELVSEIMNTYSTDFEREKALYEKICLTCSYDYDSLETGLTKEGQTIYGVLIEKKAVCGGYANTFHFALNMMGIENEIERSFSMDHAWNKVCLDGDWYEVDVTWGDNNSNELGYEYNYNYFNLTTDEMSKSHERSGRICYGTKYSSQYIMEQNKQEFLNNTKCINTMEQTYKYIAEMLNKNIGIVEFVTTNDNLFNDINTQFSYGNSDDKTKVINVMTDADYYFYNRSAFSSGKKHYKNTDLDGVYEIWLEFEALGDYRLKENYFGTIEEFYKYAHEQMQLGATEIIVYLGMNQEDVEIDYSQLDEYAEEYRKEHGIWYGISSSSLGNICDSGNLCCLEIKLSKSNIQN